MVRRARLLAVGPALLLGACATREPPVLPALADTAGGRAASRTDALLGPASGTAAPSVSIGRDASGGVTRPREAEGPANISLDLADRDLREIAAQVLGAVLRVDYTIDPAVRGTATLRTANPVSREGALALLEAALSQHGATLIRSGGLYQVIPAGRLAASGFSAGSGPAVAGSALVALRYAAAPMLARELQPYVGAGGRILADAGRNALVVSGEPGPREALLELIRAFDVDLLAGRSFALLPVAAGSAKETADALQQTLRTGAAPSGLTGVVPLERIGAVLIVASEPEAIAAARRAFGLIAARRRDVARDWRVFSLHNAASADAASVLQLAFARGRAGAPPARDGVRVVADAANNAVLVLATAEEARTVEAMLRRIDTPPLQVRIDAVVAEVTLDGALRYGTQFYIKSRGIGAALSLGNSASSFGPTVPGFVLSGPNGGGAALSALGSDGTLKVLSTPQLMVADGQMARLQVGDLVPYLTSASQSTLFADSPIINSVDYRQTGVTLEVTPRIGDGGAVTVDIAEEVSEPAAPATAGGITSPTFTVRRVESRVAVQDGQTVGVVGLVRDSDSRGNSGIPYLRAAPVLGALAANQANRRERAELIVLLTPHVVRDARDARALAEDLRDEVTRAAATPGELRLPPAR